MTDPFRTHTRSLSAPPEDGDAIVPSDTGELGTVTRAIFVGGGGDVRARLLSGAVVTLANVPPGTLLPLRVAQVFATGTNATALVGLW